jgi:hypothetical protein
MQPVLIPIPAERIENFSLRGRCASTGIKNMQRVVRVARENDVVERFTLHASLWPSPESCSFRLTRPRAQALRGTGVQRATESANSTYFFRKVQPEEVVPVHGIPHTCHL